MPTTNTRNTTPKQPQDHLAKASHNGQAAGAEGPFTFTHRGEVYTFAKDFDEVITPGWLMDNRKLDPLDLTFTILEQVAGPDALAAIRQMSWTEFQTVSEKIGERIGDLFQQT